MGDTSKYILSQEALLGADTTERWIWLRFSLFTYRIDLFLQGVLEVIRSGLEKDKRNTTKAKSSASPNYNPQQKTVLKNKNILCKYWATAG